MKRKVDISHWMDVGLRRRHNPFDKVSVSTLENYAMEIRALVSAAQSEMMRLSNVLALVEESVRRKDGPDHVVVADHAIVRWLERYEGFDVSRVEAEIAKMLDDGRPEVAVRDGVVITILPPGGEARP